MADPHARTAAEKDGREGSPIVVSGKSRRTGLLVLPFVPIALAIIVAVAVRVYRHDTAAGEASTAPIIPTEKLLGTKAPDFSLRDAHAADDDAPVTLSLAVDKGPVLLVFYFGYSCPRCIGHLSTIDGELEEFSKAGLQVMAISPWSVANTRDSIQTYGDFHFPLLSDPEGKVAKAYGLIDDNGEALHGIFIVDRERRIQFAARTDHPFTDLDEVLAAGKKLQTPTPNTTK
ncbi:MAG TPA: redoxin domain-containing protein [Phycisphaerae bacterium]|jgi:peroxiredoxin